MKSTPEYRDEERLDLPSASKMERTVACPGSHNLEKTLPPEAFKKDEEEDEWAQKGTRIHTAFETGNTLDLDSEEVEIYKQGVKYEEQIVQKWMEDKQLEDCEEGPREMRVFLHDPLHFPELLGSVKIDRHYFNKERGFVLITDLKSGWNPNLPSSPHSWQLRFGAVALHREEYGDWMKEARVGYCRAQSKVTTNDYCDYQEMDLKYSWDSIAFHLWESSQPDAPLHPGNHCSFCPCKAWCVHAAAYAMIPIASAKRIPESEMMTWELMVQHMRPEDLVKVWEVSTITEKIIEAVKARLKELPPKELEAVGLELGKGRTLDPIVDVAGAFTALLKEFPEEAVLRCMKLGKTDLAKLAQEQKGKTKEQASKWVSDYLDAYIKRMTSEAPLRRIKVT